MTLKPGTMLGQYEILDLIGKGGMGEVYRAHDKDLKREVALKVLPTEFARDPDRVARFRREAQLLASLNHQNIAAIYGLGEDGGRHFLVMELVLGETLADRVLREGPVPVDEVLEIGHQIAEALEAAHEKTIIHRDLKPANVKLTPEGKVKVLDFGLAKAFAAEDSDSSYSQAPTLSASPTIPGAILGTPAYMSPEQAKGKKVDRRTDIWALGCVLYELLTGQGAFHRLNQSRDRKGAVAHPGTPPLAGARPSVPRDHQDPRGGSDAGDPDTVQEILARVLQAEPDWTLLPAETPAHLRFLLRRCLQKDVKERFHAAPDVRIQIEEAQAAPAIATAAIVVPSAKGWRRPMPLGLAALLAVIIGIIAGLAVWTLKQAPARPVTRTVVALPQEERLAPTSLVPVALSPDGSQLAYVGQKSGGSQLLYLRAMDSLEARPLPGTEDADMPFFSPDGQWVGFFAGSKLKKVPVGGGAVMTLADASTPWGASWGDHDRIAFAPAIGSGLFQVSGSGGAPEVLTSLKEGDTNQRWPQWLPGGKAVVFVLARGTDYDNAQIVLQRIDTGERTVLIEGGTFPHYVPSGPSAGLRTGHLVYWRAGTLMAVPFDLGRLEVTGSPTPIVEGVIGLTNYGAAQFSVSPAAGSLVYVAGNITSQEHPLVWVDRQGKSAPLAAPPRNYDDPRLSPDGQRIAVQIPTPPSGVSIWVYDIRRGTSTRISFEVNSQNPIWTPDSKQVTYWSIRGASLKFVRKAADGSGAEEELISLEGDGEPSSWSPDGQTLFFRKTSPKTGVDLWLLPLAGDPGAAGSSPGLAVGAGPKPRTFLQTQSNEDFPKISPDGHWLAYVSNESGRNEIYVQPYPGPGGKWQISTEGGIGPVWSRNGKELFYYNGGKIMAVEIAAGPDFAPGTPKLLFQGQYGGSWGADGDYDVTPDGQRFLFIEAGAQNQAAATQINVVLNWFEELKRRVPVQQ